jgi:hypothetical protein
MFMVVLTVAVADGCCTLLCHVPGMDTMCGKLAPRYEDLELISQYARQACPR